ncbi:MAG: energy transducer TonB [Bacteroidota bacterium]|nr:energy transducer TonB [Bacteroidota bacterium]
MKTFLLLTVITIFFVLASCSSSKIIVTDEAAYFPDAESASVMDEVKKIVDTTRTNFDTTTDIPPVPIATKAPDYPTYYVGQSAYLIEGEVWIKMFITKEGNPKRAYIIKSSNRTFNKACLEAAMQWKFKPAIIKGNPTTVWVSIPFKFQFRK